MDTLTFIEARVLSVLVEKEGILPGQYPLTLKGIVRACNQKSDRIPITYILESEAFDALQSLLTIGLVSEHSAKFVTRYAHELVKYFHIARNAPVILSILVLHGPLTVSGIRVHNRTHKFDTGTIRGLLLHMSRDREEPLVATLPRQHGERELRWTHLLTGPVEKTDRPELSIREMMDMIFDLQHRLRTLEEDVLVKSM